MFGKKKAICFFVIFLLVNVFGLAENEKSQDEKIEKSENYVVLENKNNRNLKNDDNDNKESGLIKDVDLKNNENFENNKNNDSKKNLENKKNDTNRSIANQEDKKIGLVLSGGTAKGLAHIGILKVLDEEKVPIEYVT